MKEEGREKVTLVVVRWVRVGMVHEGRHLGIGQKGWVHACLHIEWDSNVILLDGVSIFGHKF